MTAEWQRARHPIGLFDPTRPALAPARSPEHVA